MTKLKDLYRRIETHIPAAQSIIAVLTGVITIAGAGYSVYRYLNPAENKGRMDIVIQDGESGGPIAGVPVEILSAGKALITTIAADENGRASYTLKEGGYHVRVKREGYFDATRGIQVTPDQTVDVTIRLTKTTAPVKGIGNAVKKIIGR
jgi:5-hydroxyisourate hydrolase-like protein (transthyretin family)